MNKYVRSPWFAYRLLSWTVRVAYGTKLLRPLRRLLNGTVLLVLFMLAGYAGISRIDGNWGVFGLALVAIVLAYSAIPPIYALWILMCRKVVLASDQAALTARWRPDEDDIYVDGLIACIPGEKDAQELIENLLDNANAHLFAIRATAATPELFEKLYKPLGFELVDERLKKLAIVRFPQSRFPRRP